MGSVAVKQVVDCFHARTRRSIEYQQPAPAAQQVSQVCIETPRLGFEGVGLEVECGRVQQDNHVETEGEMRLFGVQLRVTAVGHAVPQLVQPRHVRPDEGSPLVHWQMAAYKQHRRLVRRGGCLSPSGPRNRRTAQDHQQQNRAMHQVSFFSIWGRVGVSGVRIARF